MRLAEDTLTANRNDITGFVAPNDSTAGGIIQALAAQGLAGKVLTTGQDFELTALQRVYQGTQGMSVFKDTVIEGKAAAQAAIELARKQQVTGINGTTDNGFKAVPSILATPQAVTKSNLKEVVELSGLYKWADVAK
jgi:D-xylose transport system substrate-binding protein